MIFHAPFWVGFGLGALGMYVALGILTLWMVEKRRRP